MVRVEWPSHIQRPAASVLTYSISRREIFRIGDCHYRIGETVCAGGKEIDDYHGNTRAEKLKVCLFAGMTVAELLENDQGRDLILHSLANQYQYANASEGYFAYPVINGDHVHQHLMEAPLSVPEGSLVVMTSDGFDFPCSTLAVTMAAQERSYALDTLRIGLDGARPATKGLVAGMTQHDDQTYVSLLT